MARKPTIPRKGIKKKGERGLDFGTLKIMSTLGERKNYNFQPSVTEYELWPFSTIEWVASEGKYKARAIVQHKTTDDLVVFNSWHQDYGDAERPIDLLRHSLQGTAERPIYNIFAETIDIHTADIGSGSLVNVTEVLAIIWSMSES
jgi:hypothetical protein